MYKNLVDLVPLACDDGMFDKYKNTSLFIINQKDESEVSCFVFSDMPAVESRALGNLGRVYVMMGKYNRALDL